MLVPLGPSPTGTVQRHASFEHRWLGDGKPVDLREVSVKGAGWRTILERQIKLMALWRVNPCSVDEDLIHSVDKDIVTVRLGPERVLATYGDVNALPDYLANPEQVDSMGADILMPILQLIRQESFNQFTKLLTGRNPSEPFALAPFQPTGVGLVDAIVETDALDVLTAGLGPAGQDHYRGLLARNACHFAPYSWHRWSAANYTARRFAESYHRTRNPEDLRQARNFGGYADHFLEDSFAAGHLIDKTLVMQWFVEWAKDSDLLPDHDVLHYLTAALQPGLQAGKQLYDPSYAGPSHDPQTVQELRRLAVRATGGGNGPGRERDQVGGYLDYLTFLTSAASQLAAAELHDHYNGSSLWVASAAQPAAYRIWGDDTLLSGADGGAGVLNTADTAYMSRAALDEIVKFGATSISQATIRGRFPTRAGTTKDNLTDLHTWATGQKKWVQDNVFDTFADELKALLLKLASPRLGVVSRDEPLGQQWSAGLGDKAVFDQVGLLPDGDHLFLASDGYLYEADARTGAVLDKNKKKMPLPHSGGSKTTTLAMDAKQVYAGISGHVHAAPRNGAWTGGPTWSTKPLGRGDTLLPVSLLTVGDRLFAASHGYLYELDKNTGQELQRVTLGDWWAAGDYPVDLATDGKLIYAGTHAAAYAVTLQGKWDNRWVWATKQHLGNTGVYQTVRILLEGGRLFAVTNGWAYELRPATGDVMQSIKFNAAGIEDHAAHLASDGGRLYIGSHGAGYALPLDAGWGAQPAWRTERLSVLYEGDPVAMMYLDDRLFAGCDGYVYELDLLDGTVRQQWLLTTLLTTALNFDTELATDGGGRLYAGLHGYAYGILLAGTLSTPTAVWPLTGLAGGKVPDRRGLYPATAANLTFSASTAIGEFAVFNGTSSSVSTARPALDTSRGQAFTASAWVRLDTLPAGTAVVLSQAGVNVSAFSLNYSAGLRSWVFERATADVRQPGFDRLTAQVTPTPGVWTHVAAVYDPEAQTDTGTRFTEMRIYINGRKHGALAVDPARVFASSGPFQIGVARNAGVSEGYLRGAVRDVRVYRQALDELRLEPRAAAFWRLNETSGTVVHDTQGRHNAKATSITWQSVPGIGGVANYNNSISEIATPGAVVNCSPAGSFTVAGWIRLDRAPSSPAILVGQEATTLTAVKLEYWPTTLSWHFVRYGADRLDAPMTEIDSGVVVRPGEWRHVTGVYDAATSQMHIYIDGTLRKSGSFLNSSAIDAKGALSIGCGKYNGGADGRLLGGVVRDVRAYQQALSAEQVKALLAR
jgi:hypothetical protein